MCDCLCAACDAQAAREIAKTVANSANRVYLNSDSLLLNLVSWCVRLQ